MTLFSDATSHYFFSAILQANAAIIAIIGVFAIFKIQSLQSGIDSIKNALSIERGVSTNIEVDPSIIAIFDKKALQEKEKYLNEEIRYTAVWELLNSWIDKEKNINNFKSNLKKPTILIASGIVVGGIGLILANIIHEIGSGFELTVLFVINLFQIYIVYRVVKFIFDTLGINIRKEN